MSQLLELLQKNARATNAELAELLGQDESAVGAEIRQLEADGTIMGYTAIVDQEQTARGMDFLGQSAALIEISSPERLLMAVLNHLHARLEKGVHNGQQGPLTDQSRVQNGVKG